MKITMRSELSGQESTREIDITEAQYRMVLRNADLIQNVIGHLSADDREFLITGTTPQEWEDLLPPEEPEADPCPADPLCMGDTCDIVAPCFHCMYHAVTV